MAGLSARKLLLHAAILIAGLCPSQARLQDGRAHGNMMPHPQVPKVPMENVGPVVSRNGTELPPYDTVYYFDQLIDHDNPELGTFQQRYWHTYEFYEEGGPIILSTPGEGNADGYDGYLTNRTINGLIAQQQNGSTIVLEHRFYGYSNPYPDLTVNSLKVHNIQQAIDDLVYFAENVKLPMPNGDQVGPDNAPWILVGGSYSGALTSWTLVDTGDVFWAGYASSAVVEAILDFWAYFEPIRENMPKNCSADVQAVISYVDEVFTGTNETAIEGVKDAFGLGAITHLDDAAGALRNNLWDWQSLQITSGPNAQFYQFCDALEVDASGTLAPEEGFGLEHAFAAWSSYFKNSYLPRLCGDTDAETCLGTYDPTQTYYTDTSIAYRSWYWIVCNEVGFLQDGAPEGHPSLVTRLVHPEYDLRQCQYMFPEAFPEPPVTQINRTNTEYKGWDVREQRLFFANGHKDPWREATMSASGLNVASTAEQPIMISDGIHCSDLGASSGRADPTVNAVQQGALKSMATWLAEWKKPAERKRSTGEKRVGPARRADSSSAASDDAKSARPVNAWFKDVGSF
ncbi:serine carboxypeptidase S28-domain-containing protein [Schizophyllum commune]